MRLEEKIYEKYGRDTGMRIPDGYFEQLFAAMPDQLPAYPEAPRQVEMSLWQRVKPYIYMAAMFAGIWLMMKVFHNVSTPSGQNFDTLSEAVVLAMDESDMSSTLVSPSYDSDIELADELSGHYDSFEEFEADFGYTLEPQYASISIPERLLR